MEEIEVIEYVNDAGKNAFSKWLSGLSDAAYTKVTAAIAQMKAGNFGDVKPEGKGVSARRINWGPGPRIYFGKDGEKLVLLLGGGTKRRQSRDIKAAQENWAEYKKNKRKKSNGKH